MKSTNNITIEGTFKVIEILRKTQANGWKNLKPGDTIYLTLELDANSFGGRVYQSRLDIRAVSNDYEWSWRDTIDFVHTRLTSNFKVEKVI